MGMGFAPTWLRQLNPPPSASHDHFNHWQSLSRFLNPGIRDWGICNPGILGFHRDYRNSRIRDSFSPESLENGYTECKPQITNSPLYQRHARIRKINCFDCIFGDHCLGLQEIFRSRKSLDYAYSIPGFRDWQNWAGSRDSGSGDCNPYLSP